MHNRNAVRLDAPTRLAAKTLAAKLNITPSEAVRRALVHYRDEVLGVPAEARATNRLKAREKPSVPRAQRTSEAKFAEQAGRAAREQLEFEAPQPDRCSRRRRTEALDRLFVLFEGHDAAEEIRRLSYGVR